MGICLLLFHRNSKSIRTLPIERHKWSNNSSIHPFIDRSMAVSVCGRWNIWKMFAHMEQQKQLRLHPRLHWVHWIELLWIVRGLVDWTGFHQPPPSAFTRQQSRTGRGQQFNWNINSIDTQESSPFNYPFPGSTTSVPAIILVRGTFCLNKLQQKPKQ